MEPKEVSDAMATFPAGVVREGFLPDWEECKSYYKSGSPNKWKDLFNQLFYKGLKGKEGHNLILDYRKGVNPDKAWRHIKTCMGSFEPSHEHKVAGVAYLMDHWFNDYKWSPTEDGETWGHILYQPEDGGGDDEEGNRERDG